MDQKDEVKSKIDIVEVISSYIPLKKAGRNFSGLCPFHTEKTPSFMVSAERQVFKCFGCGEGGDVFTFVQKMEGYDFREALVELAKRVGVVLAEYKPSSQSRYKDKILEVNEVARKFYSYILQEHKKGEVARQYLKKRGIVQEVWKEFSLGFAPEGWENTISFLKKRNFAVADMAAAGLVIAREGSQDKSYYDRFRNRLIFPIADARGVTLGFSGRVIGEGEPKYLNSPETEVFHKGSLLFGLDVAKDAIRDTNEVLLVEGEFDALSACQAGIKNVVASKGTALTEKQVATLSRLSEKVALCFDTDLAGDKASRRGIELMDMAGLTVRVVGLGKFADPDEFCQKNPVGFKKAVRQASNIYDYFLQSAVKRFDTVTAEGKKKIGKEILPILSKISDDLVRAHYISKLAKVLDLDISLVAAAVEKKQNDLNIKSSADTTLSFEKETRREISLEENFLALFLLQEEANRVFLQKLEPADFTKGECRQLWEWFSGTIRTSKTRNIVNILKSLPKDLAADVDNLYLTNVGGEFLDPEVLEEELVKISDRIKENSLKRKLALLSGKIKKAEQDADSKALDALALEFNKLSKNIKSKIND